MGKDEVTEGEGGRGSVPDREEAAGAGCSSAGEGPPISSLPGGRAEQRVEVDKEFSGYGYVGDFGWFAACS